MRYIDGMTLSEALNSLEAEGFTGQLAAREGANIMCFTCKEQTLADALHPFKFIRLEGASDPADMIAVVALTCPHCEAKGTLTLSYGPDASTEDVDALSRLDANL